MRKLLRLPRYYFLRIKRLRGNPEYLAKGFAFGVFMGVLPLAPVQTLILIPLTILLRISPLSAFIAGILVSNPLTFIPQYYFTWKVGNTMLPGWVTWDQIQNTLQVISEQGMFDGIMALSYLGIKALAVLEIGGAILGIPAAVISYFPARSFFRAVQERRLKKQHLKKNQCP
ncbi:DUF2062 domain-containing protein [Candidatus Electronema sp. PJ]|uniref:DUF2062 domain-containing protein n=1 Tax=Candidatus Electronema sp. PJ TaxID=3401572 RepID=UPI003AA9A517